MNVENIAVKNALNKQVSRTGRNERHRLEKENVRYAMKPFCLREMMRSSVQISVSSQHIGKGNYIDCELPLYKALLLLSSDKKYIY